MQHYIIVGWHNDSIIGKSITTKKEDVQSIIGEYISLKCNKIVMTEANEVGQVLYVDTYRLVNGEWRTTVSKIQ